MLSNGQIEERLADKYEST